MARGSLNTFARVLKRQLSIVGRSPDLKNEPSVLITVARPRGSLVETGHPNAELIKIFAVEKCGAKLPRVLLRVKLSIWNKVVTPAQRNLAMPGFMTDLCAFVNVPQLICRGVPPWAFFSVVVELRRASTEGRPYKLRHYPISKSSCKIENAYSN